MSQHEKFAAGKVTKLKNGLRVLTVPTSDIAEKTVALAVFVRTGSSMETPVNNGVAHFLEHMTFQGTEKYPGKKTIEALDRLGAMYNAMTTREYTCFYLHGNVEDWRELSSILVQLYLFPEFPQNAVDTERHVVAEELKRAAIEPEEIASSLLFRRMYGNMGLGLPIGGTLKTLPDIDRQTIIDFYKSWYVPSRTLFAVSGMPNESALLEHLAAQFGDEWSYKIAATPSLYDHEQTAPHVCYKKDKSGAAASGQTQLLLAFRTRYTSPRDLMILDLVGDLLSSGFSSRLVDLLRTKMGVSYQVAAYKQSFSTGAVFTIHTGIDSTRVVETVSAILECIATLLGTITDDDLRKCIKIRRTSTLLSISSPLDYAMHYGHEYIFTGSTDPINQRFTEMDGLTMAEFKEVISGTFRPRNLNMVVYGDTGKISEERPVISAAIKRLGLLQSPLQPSS
jgi:predicted Zn-dependent peptidase